MTNQTFNPPMLGVNVFAADDEQEHSLGTRITVNYGDDKNVYLECIYGKATSDLNKGELCYTPGEGNNYKVGAAQTKTTAASVLPNQNDIARGLIPLTDIADDQFGWFGVKGTIPTLCAAGTSIRDRLGLSSVAGVLADADVDYEIVGASLVASVGGSQALGNVAYSQDIIIKRNAA